jgi:FixJ family two-component response regulator
MNLTSKEIAPMMNISFRGVELHRYRLRLVLVDDNLSKFFINNIKPVNFTDNTLLGLFLT